MNFNHVILAHVEGLEYVELYEICLSRKQTFCRFAGGYIEGNDIHETMWKARLSERFAVVASYNRLIILSFYTKKTRVLNVVSSDMLRTFVYPWNC